MLIKLASTYDGSPLCINPDHVTVVTPRGDKNGNTAGGSTLFLVAGGDVLSVSVEEDVETVMKMIQEAQRKENDHV